LDSDLDLDLGRLLLGLEELVRILRLTVWSGKAEEGNRVKFDVKGGRDVCTWLVVECVFGG
jgi:hypothetical protein